MSGRAEPAAPRLADIESLDQEGRGVAHADGKVLFIEGGIPGERVTYESFRRRPSYEEATAVTVQRPSFARVAARCLHFTVCGGCAMQHVDAGLQLAAKQRVLEDTLARIGKVSPDVILPPIDSPTWGYRQRARLSVRHVLKKGGVLVGFHERRSSFVADMVECHTLVPHVAVLIRPLRALIEGLQTRDRLPQIEVAVGDRVTVLVLRHLVPLPEDDLAHLRSFAERHRVQWWLQAKGPDSATALHPLDAPPLDYTLPDFQLRFAFRPTEFTQVNLQVNRQLVRRAMQLLQPQAGERIGDLFCGLGNFTLPIARSGAKVVGIEGSAALVERAGDNAASNGLAREASFLAADLYTDGAAAIARLGPVDKLLLDPPRDGAAEVCKALPSTGFQRLVYVSCNPATLARDAGILVHTQGYRLRAAGVVNMFPHTAHVESVALFDRG